MFSFKLLVNLCLCYLFIGTNGFSVSSFIDKCKASDNACLLKSAQKALPHIAAGVPEIGLPVLEPMTMEKVTLNEGELQLFFEKVIVNGASKCKVVKLERPEGKILVDLECPIDVHGKYTAGGKLFVVPVEGKGDFQVKTDKILISVELDITYVDGSDGEKHWKVKSYQHNFDVKEKALLKFDNLFNGDQEKAGPVNTVLNESWKDVVQFFGKPLVAEVVQNIIKMFRTFAEKIPAKDLEL